MLLSLNAGPHYPSAASQILTCNPVERPEASLPQGLCVNWLTGASICAHAKQGSQAIWQQPSQLEHMGMHWSKTDFTLT